MPLKAHPKLAAKQFIKPEATKKQARALRRKEKRMKKQITRDVNNFKKFSIVNQQFQVDPVLGETDNLFIKRLFLQINNQDSHLARGYDRVEVEKLLYGAEKASLDKLKGTSIVSDSIRATEEKKKRALVKIMHLKNTDKRDKKSLAIKLAREEFQRQEGDTASPEVQAAVHTVKIHFGMDHVRNNPKDFALIQKVRVLVQQRQKILKYLKKDDAQNYYYTITKLGLTDDVITREFAMSKQYFEDFKVWGDKKLVKLSEKQQAKKDKANALEKRVTEYYSLAQKNQKIMTDLEAEQEETEKLAAEKKGAEKATEQITEEKTIIEEQELASEEKVEDDKTENKQ